MPALSSATIAPPSAAAMEVSSTIGGSIAEYDADSSAVTVPVAATSCLSNASSSFDCIAIAAVIECHFAASLATIPVETLFTEVTPGTRGRSPSMYICGLLLIFLFTGPVPGTTPNIVPSCS